jgi:hypothetical protein
MGFRVTGLSRASLHGSVPDLCFVMLLQTGKIELQNKLLHSILADSTFSGSSV